MDATHSARHVIIIVIRTTFYFLYLCDEQLRHPFNSQFPGSSYKILIQTYLCMNQSFRNIRCGKEAVT